MEKEFLRVISTKDVMLFSSLIVIGSILVYLPTGASINITGFFMITAGLILSFILRTGYKDVATGERYEKKEYYFQQAMHTQIMSALASRPESVNLGEADKGSAVKLDIYYSQMSGKAYLQLFEYVPYRYEPCSKIYEYKVERVMNLIK